MVTPRLQVNNDPLLWSITHPPPHHHHHSQVLPSNFMLPHRLPPFRRLEAIGEQAAITARKAHILSHSLATALNTPLDALPPVTDDQIKKRSMGKGKGEAVKGVAVASGGGGVGNWKARTGEGFEAWQVFKAIEMRDIMFLAEVRDAQFELLVSVQPGSQGETPLLHAMRLGNSHREIAILLTGFISRYINSITDEELSHPISSTKHLLRSIRTNLKIAIAYGLANQQTDLLSSYLQVIIMSEGDRWLMKAVGDLSLALRSGWEGKPVECAHLLLEKWVSRELKSSEIAAVSEYIANAVGDLIMLGLWSIATDLVVGENIPLHFFARDDRITNALDERITSLQKSGEYTRLSKLLRKQIEASLEVMKRRNVGGRERVMNLRIVLDQG